MKTKAVKVLCVVLVIMLTFSANGLLAEYYIEQIEFVAEATEDDEVFQNEFEKNESFPVYDYGFEDGGSSNFEDLPLGEYGAWPEDEFGIMALNTDNVPSLMMLPYQDLTSTSVRLFGVITNTNQLVGHRGFWIRRQDINPHREIRIGTVSHQFNYEVTNLTSNAVYFARAFARHAGVENYQGLSDPATTIITHPGMPRSFIIETIGSNYVVVR